tara:strand:+ start:22 stop:555 length:534 start_codon:yes stop_codon:yes gene_type:complete
MITGIIISTPLIDFYYSFRLFNNIMFINITKKLQYGNKDILSKLYYSFYYTEFIYEKTWYDLYKLSFYTSKPINNNTEMIVDSFWCLTHKTFAKIVNPIKFINYDKPLNKLLYKPSNCMIINLIHCITSSITYDIEIIEDVVDTVKLYHNLVLFICYVEITLKFNTNCTELILKYCF